MPNSEPSPSVPPPIGLGTWKLADDACESIVAAAIAAGYRHLDCACDYGNEPAVGRGIARALAESPVGRDELWVTSKLWNTFHRPEHVRPACERSLHDLGLDYLDLYHIHFPIALEYVDFETRYPPEWFHDPDAAAPRMHPIDVPLTETWGAMEELVDAGLVRQLGVCNFAVGLLREFRQHISRPVSVLQIERHPNLVQPHLLRYCRDTGIHVTAFSPLGAPSYVPLGMATESDSVLADPVITTLAATHDCTPAQVVLAWGVQRGTSVIPKTSRPDRLRENLAAADLTLPNEALDAIDALDRGQRFNDPAVFGEAAFNTHYPIF